MTVTDRSPELARLLARYRDEDAGPPAPGHVAMRCTKHGTFVLWVNPPTPQCEVDCVSSCWPSG